MSGSTSQGSSCATARINSRTYNFQLGDYNATIIEDGALILPIDEVPFAEPVSELRNLLDPKFTPLDQVRACLTWACACGYKYRRHENMHCKGDLLQLSNPLSGLWVMSMTSSWLWQLCKHHTLLDMQVVFEWPPTIAMKMPSAYTWSMQSLYAGRLLGHY